MACVLLKSWPSSFLPSAPKREKLYPSFPPVVSGAETSTSAPTAHTHKNFDLQFSLVIFGVVIQRLLSAFFIIYLFIYLSIRSISYVPFIYVSRRLTLWMGTSHLYTKNITKQVFGMRKMTTVSLILWVTQSLSNSIRKSCALFLDQFMKKTRDVAGDIVFLPTTTNLLTMPWAAGGSWPKEI